MTREQRLVFGEDADLYDRARPSYPAELIDDVVALVSAQGRVLDAGCGTGKATVLLAARGLRGVAVDPDPAMAAVARAHLERSPGWRVDVSSFEDWTVAPADARFDLIVSAQAWHWFTPEVRFRKAYDLLRPGGVLALWWNAPGSFDAPVRRAIDAIYAEHAPEIVHRGISGHPRPDFEATPDGTSFGSPLERTYQWTKVYTSKSWVDLMRTSSDHRMLPDERREAVLDAVALVIDSHGGVYEHPFVCSLWAAERL